MNNTEHSVRFSVTLVTTHFDVFQRVVGSQFSNDIFVPFLLGIFSTLKNRYRNSAKKSMSLKVLNRTTVSSDGKIPYLLDQFNHGGFGCVMLHQHFFHH